MSAFTEENESRMSCCSERWFDNITNLAPRGGASLITTTEFILLFGGANRVQQHFNDVWVYNKKTATKKKPKWMKIECTGDVPPPRSGQSVCTYQDCVLLFGGMDSENEAIYNDLYSLNTDTWEWNYVGEAGETITARNSHSLHVISVPSFPSSSTTSTLDSESEEETAQSSVHYLVLFGGSSPELGPLGDTYYAELPAEGIKNVTEFYVTWVSLPRIASDPTSAPCAREMHSSALLPGGVGLIIAGGRTVDSVLSDVWMLTGATSNQSTAAATLSSSLVHENNVAETTDSTQKTDNEKSSLGVDPATLISVLTTHPISEEGASIDVSKVQPEVKSTQSSLETQTTGHPLAWSRLHALELPHPRCAHTAVVASGDLILFGGFTGQGISEDLIIAKSVTDIIASSSATSSAPSASHSLDSDKELSPSEILSQPISAHWMCLETSRAIDGRFAHSMATVSLNLVKKGEGTDKTGIIIFGGINATQDFNDVWVLSGVTKK